MTEISLREHVDAQIRWVDRYFEARILGLAELITKAESELNRRLEGMNEFRDALKDQAGRLATKTELDLRMGQLEKRIYDVEISRAVNTGKIAMISALASIVVSVVVALISHWAMR